jgi:hypothetical protein
MENEKFIALQNLCSHYNIEVSFIRSLHDLGIVEITTEQEMECLDTEYLGDLETMMHLHYDLEINMEGIDAISHMLRRMKEMQKELLTLRNKLNIH